MPLHYARHRPEQTTLYRLVQQHAADFIAQTEASTGARLPRFVKDEFDAFLQCGILAHGFLRLRCGECGHDTLLAFSSPAPQLGQRRRSMSKTRSSNRAQPMCCARARTGSACSHSAGAATPVAKCARAGGPCGTIRARSFALGASTPWYRSKKSRRVAR